MATATEELCYLPISALAGEIEARRVSPVEVTEAYLERIERLDGRIHAYITVTAERAREEARAAEAEIGRGRYRGPLHGVPIGLKDLFDTAGVRTTGHSALFAERVPEEDSTCTRRLSEAGAVLLGKLSMHEFAFGPADPDDAPFPPARNPWDLERVPSGSSSGSGAALAAGLCAGALGSDTGGSIRGPASMCGIVGHKPTYGLCSRAGVLTLAWSLDHAGPMARTVEDCAILLQALAGHDPSDPASAAVAVPDYRAGLDEGIDGLRIGAPLAYLETVPDLNAETFAAYRAALDELGRLGARVEPVELPYAQHINAIGGIILVAEAYAYHQESFRDSPHLYGEPFFSRTLPGALLSAADYITAQRGRERIRRAFGELMGRVDLLALPTFPYPAVTFAEDLATPAWGRTSLTRTFNMTGQPAISVPCGFSAAGLPIGLQLAGRPFEDTTVLRAARAYERATDWHQRRPPIGERR
jgi:aspartyl-tRNA(Asn)/glutamyl-tRNA(Gln) amidotransferase subunit A